MANAPHDQNNVPAKLGVLFSDGVTLVPIKLDSVTRAMMTNTTDTVSAPILALYAAGKALPRDANGNEAWGAQSSTNANVVFPVFVDASGAVLIET